MSYLLDSNILIHSAKPALRLGAWVSDPQTAVSAISRVEVLGFPELSPAARVYFEAAFELLQLIPVSAEIIEVAVRFGQLYRLRAADAIIAASAWLTGRTLVSEDGHFRRVLGLEVVNPLA